MKFAEVAILLREIVDTCPSLDGSTIILNPQKAMYHLFEGYHIYIKASLTNESLGCLRKIVEGHDLIMKIKADGIIIYESRQ
jgi:ribosomal protein L19